MGLQFRKRVNLGSGLGLNIGKKGASLSLRTKAGSISTKGYSVRTGIPGVTFRQNYGKTTPTKQATTKKWYTEPVEPVQVSTKRKIFVWTMLWWLLIPIYALLYFSNGLEWVFRGFKKR